IENVPMGGVDAAQLDALYPPTHPYSHEVIGSMRDLSAASMDDVKGFFRTWYAPNDATIVVAGDIDRVRTKELVEKYFGPIPTGPGIARPPTRAPKLTAEKRIAMEAKVQRPQLFLTWVSPAALASGDHELEVLASVLGGGKSSRLYKRLVYDMKIAQSVSVTQT